MFHGISFSRYHTLVYTINVKKLVTKRKVRVHKITEKNAFYVSFKIFKTSHRFSYLYSMPQNQGFIIKQCNNGCNVINNYLVHLYVYIYTS